MKRDMRNISSFHNRAVFENEAVSIGHDILNKSRAFSLNGLILFEPVKAL